MTDLYQHYISSNPLDRARVDFRQVLRPWDGFGVNYVETAQTANYQTDPQDYGGLNTLSEPLRQEVLDLIFGDDGLRPGLVKLFLDPFHQPEPSTPANPEDPLRPEVYDHASTTRWMRYFVREGLARTRRRGEDLNLLTTLYGPPGWMTRQRFLRGRDLDPAHRHDLARYMVDWVRYLRDTEGFPVRYLSLHNEGEDYIRWPHDGGEAWLEHGHDYNLYWPVAQVLDFLRLLPPLLRREGLAEVQLTNGETSNWLRFDQYGYADALAADEEALAAVGLVTTHGFLNFNRGFGFCDARSAPLDALRERRPELHAWVTSMSWGRMNAQFVGDLRHSIYTAKINGLIPWACIQFPSSWRAGDPNPGCAIQIDGRGGYTVTPGYHYFKQISRAAPPGTQVVQCHSTVNQLTLAGFGGAATRYPDAFLLINTGTNSRTLTIEVAGARHDRFTAVRTAPGENYRDLDPITLAQGAFSYTAPADSVTTFFGI